MPEVKTWYVYLLECKDGSIYTGIALDVAARFAVHCTGKGARYTRAHPPLRVLASEAFEDQSAALRAEIRIKKMRAKAKWIYANRLRNMEVD
jgi:putative endonuclease